jgi:hypothetical protein
MERYGISGNIRASIAFYNLGGDRDSGKGREEGSEMFA